MGRCTLRCAGLMLTLSLAACGNLSKVDDQGKSTSLVWPDVSKATLQDGTYPDPARLAMVQRGMTKDQLYALLGRPHFHEGVLMVREWDYLFHIRTPSGEQLCQYKVLFDRKRVVSNIYWRTPSCAAASQNVAENETGKARR